MSKFLERCVEITKGLKPQKQNGRSFHTTFIFHKARILSIGYNDYKKLHPYHRLGKYVGYKTNPENYQPCLHSEISAILKLGEEDLSKYSFVNVRIDGKNNLALSKPCPNCERVLRQVGFKRLFYSSENGFEELGA
jgi:deoxycytidylate deaminase